MTSQDLEHVSQITRDEWPEIKSAYEFYLNHPFCECIKLETSNKIIGAGAIIYHQTSAWLAHILIAKNERNKGYGQFLTNSLIELATDKKYKSVNLIATELGYHLYKKIGFQLVGEYTHYKNIETSTRLDSDIDIIQANANHFNDILELDYWVSGEKRKDYIEKHLSESFIIEDKGKPIATYFPTLDNGNIIAKDSAAGIELMKFRLKTKNDAAIPSQNLDANDFMQALNVESHRSSRRMRIGSEAIQWKPTCIFNRISGRIG